MTEFDLLGVGYEKFQRMVNERGWDACIVGTPDNLFYLLGRVVDGYAVICKGGTHPHVLLRRPVGIVNEYAQYYHKNQELQALLAERGVQPGAHIGVELDSLPYSEVVRLLPSAVSDYRLESADALLRECRATKLAPELEQIRQCGRIYSEAFCAIPQLYQPGMSDQEFALAFEALLRRKGHIGIFRTFGRRMESFMGSSILVGDNADAPSTYDFALGGAGMTPMLPMGANGTVLCEGQTMMVDGGGCFGPYMTDMSRVFALGTLPSEAVAAHELSVEIHHRFLREAQVGMSCADLYNQALETVRAAGFAPYFMGHRQQAAFIGHGVGLQINEMPVLHGRSKDLLQPGQVIALEPKFVFPGVGAVGVENTYIVTEQGIECVTAAAPEQIIYL
jgi:Xaa-Pro aminopeptidase